MKPLAGPMLCDGCAQPASPEHLAERIGRLEIATRFRPIHVGTVFVAIAPSGSGTADFYDSDSPASERDRLLTAVGIPPGSNPSSPADEIASANVARLNEFQHRGYYLTYFSECPVQADLKSSCHDGRTAHLASNLIHRLRFNYRPKHVALLGAETTFLIARLHEAGLGALLLLDEGGPWQVPESSDSTGMAKFRASEMSKTSGGPSAPLL